MKRAGALVLLIVVAGCAGWPAAPGPARVVDAGPSPLDYVVYASLADTSMPVPLTAYRTGEADPSKVAVQLN